MQKTYFSNTQVVYFMIKYTYFLPTFCLKNVQKAIHKRTELNNTSLYITRLVRLAQDNIVKHTAILNNEIQSFYKTKTTVNYTILYLYANDDNIYSYIIILNCLNNKEHKLWCSTSLFFISPIKCL